MPPGRPRSVRLRGAECGCWSASWGLLGVVRFGMMFGITRLRTEPVDVGTRGGLDRLACALGGEGGEDRLRDGEEIGRHEDDDEARGRVHGACDGHALVRFDDELHVRDVAARDAQKYGDDVGLHGAQKVIRAWKTTSSLARNCPRTESRMPARAR